VALGRLVWVQRRNFLRTNRVFNIVCSPRPAASTVVLLWLVVGTRWPPPTCPTRAARQSP